MLFKRVFILILTFKYLRYSRRAVSLWGDNCPSIYQYTMPLRLG